MTSTAYPPLPWASSASTGTTRASATLPVVIVTSTGAWFRPPAAFGSLSATCTAIVAELSDPELLELSELPDPPDEELPGTVATAATCATTPGVMAPSGRVMDTCSPSLTSVCCAGSRAILATGVVEEAVSTTDPGVAVPPGTVPAPRPVISAADGKNTAWPRP